MNQNLVKNLSAALVNAQDQSEESATLLKSNSNKGEGFYPKAKAYVKSKLTRDDSRFGNR